MQNQIFHLTINNSCYADTQIPARKAYGTKKFRTRQASSPMPSLSKIERGREAPIRIFVATKATNARTGETIASGHRESHLKTYPKCR
jgi:hypothetical protein